MSLSRSPSPRPNGGWTTRGLTDSKSGSPARKPYNMNDYADHDARWTATQARTQAVRGYPAIQTKNEGLFTRTRRKIEQTFTNQTLPQDEDWHNREKLGRGRWRPRGNEGRLDSARTFLGNFLRKFRVILVTIALIAALTAVLSHLSE